MDEIKKKNALLKSVMLFVDLTSIHVTLHFDYADGSQLAGPFKISEELLRNISQTTGEREWSKIANKPVRVEINLDGSILSMGHFLREEWFTF